MTTTNQEEVSEMTATMTLTRSDVIVGVDTHKDEHQAVVIDGLGARLGDLRVPVRPDGYAELAAWADSHGTVHEFAIEGTGSFGAGLARYLQDRDYRVCEANRPARPGARRVGGKDDTIDAEYAARSALAGELDAVPRDTTGITESIRVTKIARDLAVNQRALMVRTIKSMIVTAPDDIRGRLEGLSAGALIEACSDLNTKGDATNPNVALARALRSLAETHQLAHQQVRQLTNTLTRLTTTAAPELLDVFGVGPDTAAELLITAGDGRIRSEAALAKLAGVCPIPAGSGKTNGRHRLNRGGNRRLNAGLYRVVIVRLKYCPTTRAYLERRTAEGLTKKEIIRCLKRYLARELYQKLPSTRDTSG